MKCRHGKKDWTGQDPKCAFDEDGNFLKDNWNCILLDKLRNDANEIWSEDNHCAILPYSGEFIILSYYKHRGRTNGFWILSEDEIRQGTEKEAEEYLGWKEYLKWKDD